MSSYQSSYQPSYQSLSTGSIAPEPLIKQPHVCQVIDCINTHIGGPALSVTNLAEALVEQAIFSHIFTLDYTQLGQQANAKGVRLHSELATQLAIRFRGFQPSASRKLRQLASQELDIIHNHGLWMFPNLYARQAAILNDLPLVISPRGMLEPWSLKYGSAQKWLAWQLYEHKNLKSATLFHATSAAEVKSIRSLGFTQPIALVPNGVHLPDLDQIADREILTQLFPELTGKRWLLYLSRIHPKKGLDTLLHAWQRLASRFPEWHLIIAGSDIVGYQTQLTALTHQLNLQQKVTFTGMLSGAHKASALGNSDLFVLPTHSENFGIAIAEALAYAMPVITTKEAPWQDLENHQCGWWIDDNPSELTRALVEGMELSSEQRKVMGLKGHELVKNKYSWEPIGQQMAAVYRWVLNNNAPPDCIEFVR
jgi:glycosyltransferase involved in cell wall biosynthesis